MPIADALAAMKRRIDLIAADPFSDPPRFRASLAGAVGRHAGQLSAFPSVGRRDIDRLIAANAAAYSVDPDLIESIIANESAFDPHATSVAGARGLMQLMPQTAQSLGVTDAYDPSQNVRGGTRYLRGLLDRFGDIELAVAAYNAGPAAVARYGGVPPFLQTQRYVRNVLQRYRSFKLHQ